MDSTSERWLPVVGYEGYYEVSDQGRVRSVDRIDCRGQHRHSKMIRLNLEYGRSGYICVQLHKDRTAKFLRVHRLMAVAFIPNPENKPQVCHNDGNPANNVLSNLRWGTASENSYDKVSHGRHYNAKKTHCMRGHEFTPENTYSAGPNGNQRQCRTCAIKRSGDAYRNKHIKREDRDAS